MNPINASINWQGGLNASSGPVSPGSCLVLSVDGKTYTPAVTAAVGTRTTIDGVSLDQAGSNQAVRIQTDGMIPNSITGLGPGVKAYARLNQTSAFLERTSSPSVSDIIAGVVNELGDVLLSLGSFSLSNPLNGGGVGTLLTASGTIAIGDWVVQAGVGIVKKATPVSLAAAGGLVGIARSAAINGQTVDIALPGDSVSAATSGLGAGSVVRVGVNASARSYRITQPSGGENEGGVCDATGAVTVSPSVYVATSAKHVINVKSYGATGDGVTDDAPAIQAAIQACPLTAQQSGHIVMFPPGDYFCASDLHVVGTLILRGASGGNHNGTSRITFAAAKGLYLDSLGTYPFGTPLLTADGTVIEDLDLHSTVIPGLTIWQASHFYSIGDKVLSPDQCAFYYECTGVSGDQLSGASIPQAGPSLLGWSTCVGDTTTDNHVTWTTRIHAGIVCYARPVICRVGIMKFTGPGVALLGSLQAAKIGGIYRQTFCDTFAIDTLNVLLCGTGTFAIGGDSNAGYASHVNVTNSGTTTAGFPAGAKGDGIYDLSFLGNSYAYTQVQACTNRPYRAEAGPCNFLRPYGESDNAAPARFSGSHVLINAGSLASISDDSSCTIIGSPFGRSIGALDDSHQVAVYGSLGLNDGKTVLGFRTGNESDYTRLAYQSDNRVEDGWYTFAANSTISGGPAWGISAVGAREGPGWFGFWDGYYSGLNSAKVFFATSSSSETDSQLRRGVRGIGDSFPTATPATPGSYARRRVVTAGYQGGVWAQNTTYPIRYATSGVDAYQYAEPGTGKVYRLSSISGTPTAAGAPPSLVAASTTCTAAYGAEYAAAWETSLPARDAHVVHPVPRNGHVYRVSPIHWAANMAVFADKIYCASNAVRNPHLYKVKVPVWIAGVYAANQLVTPSAAAIAINPAVKGLIYRDTSATGFATAGVEPTWPTIPASTVVDGGITWILQDLRTNVSSEPAFKQGELTETTDDPSITAVPAPYGSLVWTCQTQSTTTCGTVQPTWLTGGGSTTYADNGLPFLEIGSDANTYASEGVGKAEWSYVGNIPTYGVTDMTVVEGTLVLAGTTALTQTQAAYESIEVNAGASVITVTTPRVGQTLRVYNSSGGNITVVGVTVGAAKLFVGTYVGGSINAWKTQSLV